MSSLVREALSYHFQCEDQEWADAQRELKEQSSEGYIVLEGVTAIDITEAAH